MSRGFSQPLKFFAWSSYLIFLTYLFLILLSPHLITSLGGSSPTTRVTKIPKINPLFDVLPIYLLVKSFIGGSNKEVFFDLQGCIHWLWYGRLPNIVRNLFPLPSFCSRGQDKGHPSDANNYLIAPWRSLVKGDYTSPFSINLECGNNLSQESWNLFPQSPHSSLGPCSLWFLL